MNAIKLIVCGAAGRMGASIIRIASHDANLKIVGAVEHASHPDLGKGEPKLTSDLSSVVVLGDIVIDFTTPQATMEHLEACVKAKKAMVIGTTGLSGEQAAQITSASKTMPIVFAPNFSPGINVLLSIVGKVAKALNGYDVEIVEMHHNKKKDAPSGTAAKLAEVIAAARGKNMEEVGVYGREGQCGARTKDEIGVMALRGGDVVGDHTVYYCGPGERLELTHRAESRDVLAAGSLAAAKWLATQKSGLYDMQDVLGLKAI
jgi:4-hydroxy-tetrahydrodipicolinate reductase